MARPDQPGSDRELLVYEQLDHPPMIVDLGTGSAVVMSRRSPDKESPNEDAALILALSEDVSLLVVADGCGGQPAGAVASRIALQAMRDAMVHPDEASPAYAAEVLAGFDAANRAVLDLKTGAATTLVAALVQGREVRTYHAGDSMMLVTGQRGRVKLQTVAHSPTAYAVEAGMLTEHEAIMHDDRSVVLNVVGSQEMRVDVGPTVKLARRDTLVLASDGLSDNLLADEIIDTVRAGRLDRAVQKLVDRASERMHAPDEGGPGHPDDLTMIAFRPSQSRG